MKLFFYAMGALSITTLLYAFENSYLDKRGCPVRRQCFEQQWSLKEVRRFVHIKAYGEGWLQIILGDVDMLFLHVHKGWSPSPSVFTEGDTLTFRAEFPAVSQEVPTVWTLQLCNERLQELRSIGTTLTTRIKVSLFVPELSLSILGTNDLYAEKVLGVDDLCLYNGNVGSMVLGKVYAQKAKLFNSGLGSISLDSGVIASALFKILQGSVAVSEVGNLVLGQSGASSLKCTVQEWITGYVNGPGVVKNYGNASVQWLWMDTAARYRRFKKDCFRRKQNCFGRRK